MYRLQIYLRSTSGDDAPISKFLHITRGDISIEQLLYDADARFQSVYPGRGRLTIVRVQDSNGCDLDPGFLVHQVVKESDELHLFTNKAAPQAFKRVLNPAERATKQRKLTTNLTPFKIESDASGSSMPPPDQETPTPAARKANNSMTKTTMPTGKPSPKVIEETPNKVAANKGTITEAAAKTNGGDKKPVAKSKATAPTQEAKLNRQTTSRKVAKVSTREPAKIPTKATTKAPTKAPAYGKPTTPPPSVIQETPVKSNTEEETAAESTDETSSSSDDSSDEEEQTVPVKAVEMPKSASITPPIQKQKPAPAHVKNVAIEPKGPAAPAAPTDISPPQPARKSLSNLSKLDSLQNVDVHDGQRKVAQKKQEDKSDSENLSSDNSSENDDSSSGDDSSSDSEGDVRPRTSSLLSSMMGDAKKLK